MTWINGFMWTATVKGTVSAVGDALVDEHRALFLRSLNPFYRQGNQAQRGWVICLRSEPTAQPDPWPLNFSAASFGKGRSPVTLASRSHSKQVTSFPNRMGRGSKAGPLSGFPTLTHLSVALHLSRALWVLWREGLHCSFHFSDSRAVHHSVIFSFQLSIESQKR